MTGTQSPDLRQQALAAIKRRSLLCFVIPGLIFAYLVYVFFAFEVRDALEDVKLDNAAILVGDSYSYKTEVSLNNRSGDYIVAIEGEKKGRYTPSAHQASAVVVVAALAPLVARPTDARNATGSRAHAPRARRARSSTHCMTPR